VVAVAGLLVTIGAAFGVLSTRHRLDAGLAPRALLDELAAEGLLDDATGFYEAMIMRLDRTRSRDADTIERATTAFTAMLCGILVLLRGLTLAALVG